MAKEAIRLGAMMLSLLLFVVASPASAATAYTKRELQIRTELVYYSSAREAALKRQYSAGLLQRDQQISIKQRELKAARAQAAGLRADRQQTLTRIEALEAEMLELKRQQNDELAQRDLEFARMRDSLEAVAHDLMRTPEGERAIEVYLAQGPGSAELAIEILQRATVKRTAADLRDTAYFALDARAQGRIVTPRVVQLFEAVVSVDDGEFFDWYELSKLYSQVGADERRRWAANNALSTAQTAIEYAMAQNGLAVIDLDDANYAKARERFGEILNIGANLAQPTISGKSYALPMGEQLQWARIGLMAIAANEGNYAAAHATTQQMVAEAIDEMNRSPDSTEAKVAAIRLMLLGGGFYSEFDRMQEAWDYFDRSLKLAKDLSRTYPDIPLLKELVADSLVETARVMADDDEYGLAAERLEDAFLIYHDLALADPSTLDLPLDVADTLILLGRVRGAAGDFQGAAKEISGSLDVLDQLARDFPGNRKVTARRASTVSVRARLESELGQKAKAVASASEALKILQNMARGHENDAVLQYDITSTFVLLAEIGAPGHSWSGVVARLNAIGARRPLLPSETRWLEKARENATTGRSSR